MRGKFDQKVVRLNLFSAVLLFPDKTTLSRIVFLPTQGCKLGIAHKKIPKSNKIQGESRPVMDLPSECFQKVSLKLSPLLNRNENCLQLTYSKDHFYNILTLEEPGEET